MSYISPKLLPDKHITRCWRKDPQGDLLHHGGDIWCGRNRVLHHPALLDAVDICTCNSKSTNLFDGYKTALTPPHLRSVQSHCIKIPTYVGMYCGGTIKAVSCTCKVRQGSDYYPDSQGFVRVRKIYIGLVAPIKVLLRLKWYI